MSENPKCGTCEQPIPMGPLYAALAKAQGEFLPIRRTRTVTVQPKKRDDGSWPPKYTFDYAPLEEVKAATTQALSKYGLCLFHRLSRVGGVNLLVTILGHESGAEIRDEFELPKGLEGQQLGSAKTYIERYSVGGVLGVAAEYDDDGNAAEGNEATPTAKSPPRSQPTPPAPKAQKPPERKPEPPKAPPVDPQMQADIDRRKAEQRVREAASEAMPGDANPALAMAQEELARAEAAAKVAPVSLASDAVALESTNSPSWSTLPDGHVPDEVAMPKGSATGALLQELLKMRGFGFSGAADIAKTLGFIAENSNGGNPQTPPFYYGQARSVIRALEAMS